MINHTDNKNASPTNKTIKARIPFYYVPYSQLLLVIYKKPLVVIMAKGSDSHTF